MEVECDDQYIAIGFVTGKNNMSRPCHFRAISVPSCKQFLDYNRLVGRYRSLSEKHQRFSFELFSDTWRHLKELGQSYISSRPRRTQRTVHERFTRSRGRRTGTLAWVVQLKDDFERLTMIFYLRLTDLDYKKYHRRVVGHVDDVRPFRPYYI